MPEGIEIAYYRETALLGLNRPIAAVEAEDDWFLKGGLSKDEIVSVLTGSSFVGARRRGKLLLLDLAGAGRGVVGLRFGMTGRLLIDGASAIERLEYSSGKNDPAWDRFAVTFADGGRMSLRDPRRLGGVELDPDEDALGPDMATLTLGELRGALAGGRGPLKARLLDQSKVAGLGNLLTDEILWRASLHPLRVAGSLQDPELRRLQRHIRGTVKQLAKRGGSHTGDLQDHRHREGTCPRDGSPLDRHTIGGRTTYSCREHQQLG